MAAAGTAQASDAESKMNSVERMIEYDKNAEEAALETSPEVAATLPLGWPRSGSLALEKVELRYRPELPLVLRGISFEAASGDKIGIVGCVMCLRCAVLCAPAALPPYLALLAAAPAAASPACSKQSSALWRRRRGALCSTAWTQRCSACMRCARPCP